MRADRIWSEPKPVIDVVIEAPPPRKYGIAPTVLPFPNATKGDKVSFHTATYDRNTLQRLGLGRYGYLGLTSKEPSLCQSCSYLLRQDAAFQGGLFMINVDFNSIVLAEVDNNAILANRRPFAMSSASRDKRNGRANSPFNLCN